ncbi:hypothetical protein CLCR_11075 [Cladophialophora carrionii]|uniref:Uncharacterized protein n=1 Tax=Cladophialophora carrionii TaxID=86049 RepID=A0A1C1CV87_9EURO|nr:hypothetical protein CLCR_11075 [Cladophialophora carrionii]
MVSYTTSQECQLSPSRYWIDKQRNEEMAIFLAFDSDRKEGGARCKSCQSPMVTLRWLTEGVVCPHVSFDNPNAPEGVAKRESVECRAIVITKVS